MPVLPLLLLSYVHLHSSIMKKLFRKTLRSQASESATTSCTDFPVPQAVVNSALPVGLQPKFTVPPIPHPTPHYRIAVFASESGLILRPVTSADYNAHVRVSWGESLAVEQLDGSGEVTEDEWENAAVVYGVLGMLRLNAGMMLATSATHQ